MEKAFVWTYEFVIPRVYTNRFTLTSNPRVNYADENGFVGKIFIHLAYHKSAAQYWKLFNAVINVNDLRIREASQNQSFHWSDGEIKTEICYYCESFVRHKFISKARCLKFPTLQKFFPKSKESGSYDHFQYCGYTLYPRPRLSQDRLATSSFSSAIFASFPRVFYPIAWTYNRKTCIILQECNIMHR